MSPFRIVNPYGIFSIVVEHRLEIIVEGSNNGEVWRPYRMRYQPEVLKKMPTFIAPFHPRLDWQMWIAAQGDYKHQPWLINFSVKILEDSREVLRLIKGAPFGKWPPRYLRLVVYEYQFTDPATRKKTGAWWKRERGGLYAPVISLPSR